jgi:hypothetical protein
MPFPQQQVEWLIANRAKILRFAFVPQLLAAVALLGVAYFTGKTNAHLLLKGAHTRGKIVGFQPRQIHRYRTPTSTGIFGRTVYLPIVEFDVRGALVRFEEHKLVPGGEGVGWPVAVLYDPGNMSLAMIDRPFWNWVPWAPALAIGAFLALVSLKGLFVFLAFPQPASSLATGAQK